MVHVCSKFILSIRTWRPTSRLRVMTKDQGLCICGCGARTRKRDAAGEFNAHAVDKRMKPCTSPTSTQRASPSKSQLRPARRLRAKTPCASGDALPHEDRAQSISEAGDVFPEIRTPRIHVVEPKQSQDMYVDPHVHVHLAPASLLLTSALAEPVCVTKIRNIIQSAPDLVKVTPVEANAFLTTLRRWVEDARLTTVEPDVGAVESYFWAADLSKLHATANWPVLRGFVLRACGCRAQASRWQSLLLAQVVHAMKMQWTEDEKHRKIISKWVAQAPDAAAFKVGHLAILKHIVDPEAYLGFLG